MQLEIPGVNNRHYFEFTTASLDIDLPSFDGFCLYDGGVDNKIKQTKVKSASECMEACSNISECTAFAHEAFLAEPDLCDLYRHGPYTHGNGRNNARCYIIPKGM